MASFTGRNKLVSDSAKFLLESEMAKCEARKKKFDFTSEARARIFAFSTNIFSFSKHQASDGIHEVGITTSI